MTSQVTTAPPTEAPAATAAVRLTPGLRRWRDAAAAALAAVLAAAGLCLGDALAGMYPFGGRTRSVSDLGNQYVPFYAHWWDLLHGRAQGDLLFNWNSGYGSSYLPDIGTYLTSPFSPLVALFPRDRVDLALYVITVAMTATSAVTMTAYLLRLRRGNPVPAACFGAAYALCGWSVTDAAYNPMWLTGLIGFPLLCLAAEWILQGRRPVLGTLLVAAVWTANFYTAYLAVLGSLLVLAVRAFQTAAPWRARLTVAVRAAVRTGLGIGLAAPLFAVVYLGTRAVWPIPPNVFHAVPWTTTAARALPTTYGFNSPGLFVGTFVLLAALTVPFDRRLTARFRRVWSVALAGMLLSMQWGPTVLVWYAFTYPNGSSFRQTFVLCGMLVTAGWLCFSRGLPGLRALLGGAALLAVTVGAAATSKVDISRALPVMGATAALGAVLYALYRLARSRGLRVVAAASLALLPAVQLAEAAVSTSRVDLQRLAHLDTRGAWGPWEDAVSKQVAAADDWPNQRTEPGPENVGNNDPQLLGGQGAQYYSSLTSQAYISTLAALGYGWTSRGRAPRALDNPVTDALFSVGTRVLADPGPAGHDTLRRGATVTTERQEVPPLVTVRPAGTAPHYGPDVFRNQEQLLGATVYTRPAVQVKTRAGAPAERVRGQFRTPAPAVASGKHTHVITASCRAGQEVYLYAPDFAGTATLDNRSYSHFVSVPGQQRAPMQPLGTAPSSGQVRVELRAVKNGSLPARPLGCLDRDRLAAAVQHLRATAATHVAVSGHGLTATLPAGSTGTAVVAAPRIQGWQCSLGDGPSRPAGVYGGLIAVPLDGKATTLACSFSPPGLKLGSAAGAASAAGLAVVGLWSARRRRAGLPTL